MALKLEFAGFLFGGIDRHLNEYLLSTTLSVIVATTMTVVTNSMWLVDSSNLHRNFSIILKRDEITLDRFDNNVVFIGVDDVRGGDFGLFLFTNFAVECFDWSNSQGLSCFFVVSYLIVPGLILLLINLVHLSSILCLLIMELVLLLL